MLQIPVRSAISIRDGKLHEEKKGMRCELPPKISRMNDFGDKRRNGIRDSI
jgi:hypothetical protein